MPQSAQLTPVPAHVKISVDVTNLGDAIHLIEALIEVPVATVAEWYRYRIVACLVTSSSPVPLKTHRVGQRCKLNLSRDETSSRWCGS
ncbi:histone-lysine N-methyltransferase SETMAR [Trichonephila clavipes]|nr:histone-lysine N-methyltransferase SETMAR [Trichonephila clavipes]